MTDLRTMAVRLPVSAIEKLDAMRKTECRTRSDMVRELICREIGVEVAAKLAPPPHRAVTVPPHRNNAPKPPEPDSRTPRTAIELFRTGLGITAIAAMLRRPYLDICVEIGLGVDAEARRKTA